MLEKVHLSDGQIRVEELASTLASLGLTVFRASKLSGVARATVEKACSGRSIRPATLAKLVNGLKDHGYDIERGQRISPKEPHLSVVSSDRGDNTKSQATPNRQKPLETIGTRISDCDEALDQLLPRLDRLVKAVFEEPGGLKGQDYEELLRKLGKVDWYREGLSKNI